MSSQLCPVCGFSLDFKPWSGLLPADEICPCCGIQFGYDDDAGGDLAKRAAIYSEWRRRWVDAGMSWWSKGRKPPSSWDPVAQLVKVESR